MFDPRWMIWKPIVEVDEVNKAVFGQFSQPVPRFRAQQISMVLRHFSSREILILLLARRARPFPDGLPLLGGST